MICADTFRAGAFDQLKQNATKARIPFYGRLVVAFELTVKSFVVQLLFIIPILSENEIIWSCDIN